MRIATWFTAKNFNANERMMIETATMGGTEKVMKETEKAMLINFNGFQTWVPKACVENNIVELKAEEIPVVEEKTFKLGDKVKKGLKGRKIWTIISNQPSYDRWLCEDNTGKKMRIEARELVLA